jgi:hypothetical protein
MYDQIKNPVFIFYIFIILLESIPPITPYPFPYTVLPYSVVILVQMLLDFKITFGVNKLDNIQNNKKVDITRSNYLKMENSSSKNQVNYILEKSLNWNKEKKYLQTAFSSKLPITVIVLMWRQRILIMNCF